MTSLSASITFNKGDTKISHFELEYFYDNGKTLGIEEVPNKEFKKAPSQFTFGHKKGNFWFKLVITNKTKKSDFIIHLTEPYYIDATLFKRVDSRWIEDNNGHRVLMKERSLHNHLPSFAVEIAPNTTEIFYLRGSSKLTTSNEIEIYTKESFNSFLGQYHNLLYMFYFGGISIIVLLNIFLFIRLKEIIYIYYSGYTLFFLLWIAAYSGLILYTPIDGYYHEFIMVTSLFIMFLTLFSNEFLNVKKYIPVMDKIFKSLSIVFALLAILIVISFEPWFEVMNNLASLTFLLLLGAAISIWRKYKQKNVKYYLFAISVYMVTISLMSAMVNGWIDNSDITRYSFLFGSFFEILFFTLVLTNRFYIMQNDKLKIQNELLLIKTANEGALEREIEERTKDIKKLLGDKDLLLRELHHRVKNNFHMVTGLLWMESDSIKISSIKDIFLGVINRINSMALVHQYLYNSSTLTEIGSKEYIEKIVLEIENIYNNKNIKILKEIEAFILDIDSAMSLSMIVNEVLSNSIKHSKKNGCTISICFQRNNSLVTLIIKDNGIGFKTEDAHKGLGLKLVNKFAEKLAESQYSFEDNNGTCFTLTFNNKRKTIKA